MKVEGVRDDGALLITDGPAAAIVSDDGVWLTLRSSALARGGWEADSRALPDSLPGDLGERLAAKRVEFLELDSGEGLPVETVRAAAGHDITPGHDELHHWWVYGEGRGLWETWTELVAALVERVPGKSLETLETWASRWFIERHGYAAGSDINRVKHGKPPRGDRIGPG